MVVDFAVSDRTYKDFIRDISAEGLFIETGESIPLEEEISMSFPLPGRKHVKVFGKVARAGSGGIGVRFETNGRADCRDLEVLRESFSEPEAVERETTPPPRTGKVKKRRLRWRPSASRGVTGYRLYWSEGGSIDYRSAHADLGPTTEILLPDDVPGFPRSSGELTLGVSAVGRYGNESDLTTVVARFDFSVPDSPGGLEVEMLEDYALSDSGQEDEGSF